MGLGRDNLAKVMVIFFNFLFFFSLSAMNIVIYHPIQGGLPGGFVAQSLVMLFF